MFTILCSQLYAQEIGIKVDYFGIVDNREYKAPYTTAKTILGSTISPQFYLLLEDKHKLIGGIHYSQDFGKNRDDKSRVNAIAYYNYNSENVDFAIGLIPRYDKIKDIHRLVLADTFMYYKPNIEGMYFKYRKEKLYQSIFIDWLSQQSKKNREQFVIGISGLYKFGNFYLKNDGLLYHNALTSTSDENQHVQDNAVLVLNIGLDLSNKTFLDSLTFDAGLAAGFDRLRTEYEETNTGFISNVHLAYKKVFINNTIYLGGPLNLPNGDPFYRRGKYDRLDLGWIPFKTKRIESKLIATFHFREGGIDNQQTFSLRYKFDQSLWHKNSKK